MTHKDEHGNLWIVNEPDGRCELCGAVEETRPYGPGGEQICFECGEKDPEGTARRYREAIAGTKAAIVPELGIVIVKVKR